MSTNITGDTPEHRAERRQRRAEEDAMREANDLVARLRDASAMFGRSGLSRVSALLAEAAAELERLQARIADAPVYFVPMDKPATTAAWVDLINSVKSLNGLRGKRVRLVVDDAPNTPEHT
jgi:dTDP-4-amino-4,6-dideoxygalactose transaminase